MLLVCGESLIDMVQNENGTFTPLVGGSPLNCSIAAAQFCEHVTTQQQVQLATGISYDYFGSVILNTLRNYKVTPAISKRSALPTSLALVTLKENTKPTYSFYRENIADRDIELENIRRLLKDVSILQVGSLALVPSNDFLLWSKVVEEAKKLGIIISIDPNCRPAFTNNPDDYRTRIKHLLHQADIIKMSDEDFSFLWPHSALDTFATKQEISHAKLQICTNGAHGALAIYQKNEMHIPSFTSLALVDTVGAGDTFLGSVLAQILNAHAHRFYKNQISCADIKNMVQLATVAAAINCTKPGCQPPSKQEACKLLPRYLALTHAS